MSSYMPRPVGRPARVPRAIERSDLVGRPLVHHGKACARATLASSSVSLRDFLLLGLGMAVHPKIPQGGERCRAEMDICPQPKARESEVLQAASTYYRLCGTIPYERERFSCSPSSRPLPSVCQSLRPGPFQAFELHSCTLQDTEVFGYWMLVHAHHDRFSRTQPLLVQRRWYRKIVQ